MSETMAAVERAVRFGIKINKNEEDSNKRVTYLYDAAGMIPAVTYMLQEYAGLAEGYCVMAIKVMGIVSETDTKGVEA